MNKKIKILVAVVVIAIVATIAIYFLLKKNNEIGTGSNTTGETGSTTTGGTGSTTTGGTGSGFGGTGSGSTDGYIKGNTIYYPYIWEYNTGKFVGKSTKSFSIVKREEANALEIGDNFYTSVKSCPVINVDNVYYFANTSI